MSTRSKWLAVIEGMTCSDSCVDNTSGMIVCASDDASVGEADETQQSG